MNSAKELIEKHGIEKDTAEKMVSQYEKKIGTEHGEFRVTDITYIRAQTREIELTCRKCNTKLIREFTHENKWRDLIHHCPECRRMEREKKKAEESKREDEECHSKVGENVGDYCITKYEDGKYTLRCRECGAEKTVRKGVVLNGSVDGHCGKHYVQKIKYDESYIGRKNNYLTVKGYARNKEGKKVFVCQCDCGKETRIRPIYWEKGLVKSCGCYQENRSVNSDEIKRIKDIYHGMKTRCLNSNSKDYCNYGGRGIKICDEWLESVDEFIEWSLAHGYANRLTIDRIDVNGNYEPDNCRWTTYKIQNVNRRPRGKKCQDQHQIEKGIPSYSA